MSDTPVELLEYLTDNGRNPFREWLERLRDRQARARIRVRLNRIRLGNFGDSKSVVVVSANCAYRMVLVIEFISDARVIQ
jgi:hypothetical protein